MSTSQQSPSKTGRSSTFVLVVGLFLLALLVVYIFTRPPAIDRSVLGLKGFATVANQKDKLDIRFFDGERRLQASDFGLRILPLYAPGFNQAPKDEKSKDRDKNEFLRFMFRSVFDLKLRSIPTLVVLSKWREGTLIREKLHPDLLTASRSYNLSFMEKQTLGAAEVRRGESKPLDHKLQIREKYFSQKPEIPTVAKLYAAQTLSESVTETASCQPMIEMDGLTLLTRCKTNSTFWVLTDPDVINNLGAGKGENYALSLGLVKALANGKPVLIDASTKVFTNNRSKIPEPDRSFSDLARFFAYPFSLFWIAFLVLVSFGLWHAWKRVSPIEDNDLENAMLASKATTLDANIAILRGHNTNITRDTQLTRTYMNKRVEQLAADILGANTQSAEPIQQKFFNVLANRNAALSEKLKEITQTLTPNENISERRLFATIRTFEATLEEARDEFGRPANPRR